MDYKKLGLGLGLFSIALGAIELGSQRRLARALGLDKEGTARTVIFGFGLRELLAGAMLLRGPALSTNVWNRVIGDAMDAGALLLAFDRSSNRRAMTGALAFVGGAAALDWYTACGLDHQTGRTFPVSRPDEQL